jgi:uncharacterized membrane protein
MVSRDPELSENIFVLGLILALIGIVLLLVLALIVTVSPTYYNSNPAAMKDTIYAGIILIVIGAAISVVLYLRE